MKQGGRFKSDPHAAFRNHDLGYLHPVPSHHYSAGQLVVPERLPLHELAGLATDSTPYRQQNEACHDEFN